MSLFLHHSSLLLQNSILASVTRLLPRITPVILSNYHRHMSSSTSYIDHKISFKKPDLDDRNYRFIQLPNNLKALLIQDPTTDKAAAALDVNIGAFEDPENIPGLAHFCEHLLFMGSSKFPDENEYSSFLSKHGGASNAYTGSQNTNYYFQVNHEDLRGALDRFSGFFTSPLFNKNSTDKEINAVDSENKKNLQNDLWRMYQLDKSFTSPMHPYHKFSTGNLKTLGETPKNQGLDIRDELLKFYNKSYSANIMKLCVLGREDLDTMSEWVYELFKDVRNNNCSVPEYSTPLLPAEYKTKIIRAKPVKDLKKVEITFAVPDVDVHWESKPHHYLSHLIGHEGSGSLLAYLKGQGWANELSAGAHTVSVNNAFFSVDIELTNNGLDHYQDVVSSVFQYIEMLKCSLPQSWIYTELKDVAQASFKFKQKGHASSTVSSLAKALEKEYIPVGDILSTSLLRKYDPELIMQYTNILTPENSRITVISKDVEIDSKEKWYGTEYSVIDYPKEFLDKLKKSGLNPHLHLPRPNEFISTNFQVIKQESAEPLLEPLLLKDDYCSKLWYKKDDTFWAPRGYIYISMKLAHTHSSIVNSMLTSLYVELINDHLKDLQYDAEVANLHVSFSKTNQGLDISLCGYNEKLTILLTRFLEGIKEFTPKLDRFKIFRDKLVRKLNNHLYEVPYSQLSGIFNSLINERSWSTKEKLDLTKQLTFEHLKNFIPTIYEQLYYEILVHGNFSQEAATEINDLVKMMVPNDIKNLQVKNGKLRSYIIPQGKTFRMELPLADEKNVNSCIQHVTQFGIYSEDLSAKTALLAQLIDEPCFDTLRTKEQLGYVVFSSALSTHGTVNLRLLIQSERDSSYLESRIDSFLKKFGNILREMPEEEFEKHKVALCKTLSQKYKNLREENVRFVTAIYLGNYNFTSKQRKAKLVEKFTKEDMIEFYEKYVAAPTAPRLVVHLKSQAIDEEKQKKDHVEGYPTGELITDVGAFKSKLFIAPVRQPVKKFEIVTPKL